MTERFVEHATLAVERTFAAAPAQVYAAWANPEARGRWDVPGDGWVQETDAHDFRVGGWDRIRFGPPGPDGRLDAARAYLGETVYLELVPERRVTFAYTIAEGGEVMSASLDTVELHPAGAGTRLVLTEQAAFFDGRDSPARREKGLAEMFDKLAAWLRADAGRPDPQEGR